MKDLIAWLLGRRPAPVTPAGGSAYRSASCPPLRPAQIRARHFRQTRLGRRGLDPADVRSFLDRVALDLARAHDAAADARREAHRIKQALRRWQSEQARTRDLHANTRNVYTNTRSAYASTRSAYTNARDLYANTR